MKIFQVVLHAQIIVCFPAISLLWFQYYEKYESALYSCSLRPGVKRHTVFRFQDFGIFNNRTHQLWNRSLEFFTSNDDADGNAGKIWIWCDARSVYLGPQTRFLLKRMTSFKTRVITNQSRDFSKKRTIVKDLQKMSLQTHFFTLVFEYAFQAMVKQIWSLWRSFRRCH